MTGVEIVSPAAAPLSVLPILGKAVGHCLARRAGHRPATDKNGTRPPVSTGKPTLLLLIVAYGAATLLHFAHNAVYLYEYPNMPASLTATRVCAAWAGVTTVGVLGYWFYERGSRLSGLVTIGTYAGLGLAGLYHYVAAPFAAHTAMMNLSILAESVTATALLIHVVRSMLVGREPRARAPGPGVHRPSVGSTRDER